LSTVVAIPIRIAAVLFLKGIGLGRLPTGDIVKEPFANAISPFTPAFTYPP
jgi:hypothetical protein